MLWHGCALFRTSRSTANSVNWQSFSFRATRSSNVSTKEHLVSEMGLYGWIKQHKVVRYSESQTNDEMMKREGSNLPEDLAWWGVRLVLSDDPAHIGTGEQTYQWNEQEDCMDEMRLSKSEYWYHKLGEPYMSSTCSCVLCWWMKSARAAGTSRSSGLSLRICLLVKSAS